MVTAKTIDDLLHKADVEYRQSQHYSINQEKVLKRAKKGPLLKKFISIMGERNLSIDWVDDQYLLKISGQYNPRINLTYKLAENSRYGEMKPFFGPEVIISSPDTTIMTNGKREYVHLPYIPEDGFSKPNGGTPHYCKKSSLAWNWLKNQWGTGITGGTLLIRRPTSITLGKIQDEEVKILAKYFR